MKYLPPYSHIPPADLHILTPLYDWFCELFALGKSFKQQILNVTTLKKDDAVLDIGCGTGVFLECAQQRFPECRFIGIDPDKAALAIARKRLRQADDQVKLIEGYAEALPLDENFVDICFCTLALHHMPNAIKKKAIGEMYRVLRKGGQVVISDFGRTDSWWLRKLLFFEKGEYLQGNLDGLITQYLQEMGFKDIRQVHQKFPVIITLMAEK